MVLCFALLASADDKSAATEVPLVDFERHVAPLFGDSAATRPHVTVRLRRQRRAAPARSGIRQMDYLGLNDTINKSNAEASLLLQKPSGQETHEGTEIHAELWKDATIRRDQPARGLAARFWESHTDG
jgi:hypothetical protein